MRESSQIPAVPPGPSASPVRALLLLAIAPAVGLGVARFAYGLLLPDMRESLHWSYSEAGLMNTANAAGYMAGALLAPAANRRVPPLAAVFVGTALSAASMLLSGCSSLFLLLV